MEFVLRYQGPVPAKAQGTVAEKHAIRLQLHPQLAELARRTRQFDGATAGLPEATVKNRSLYLDPGYNPPAFVRVPFHGVDFVPLVTRHRKLAAQVDILWLRRDKPGEILQHGGDLDNRLKSLFDGLRIPHDEKELPQSGVGPDDGGTRVYCLLEDDSLITKLTITTYQLLEPMLYRNPVHMMEEGGHPEQDVELIIRVLVASTSDQGDVPEGFNYF